MEENMTYEIFIRKCHPCDRFEHGANTDTWEYLKSCEYKANQAPPQKKDQKEFENTFKKVQKFLVVEAFLLRLKD